MSRNNKPQTYREKLAEATRGRIPRTRRVRDPLPNIAAMGVDGQDHINIYINGATELGRGLTHSARLPLVHSIFGRFDSMQSFWEYIRSEERDDRLRNLHGERLRRMVKKLTPAKVRNFRAIIMDANYQKIKQHPELVKALIASEQPFDCWYRYNRENGVQARPGYAHWLIWGFEEIRTALKEGREPDFDELMESRKVGLFDDVVAKQPEQTAKPAEEVKVTELRGTKKPITTVEPAPWDALQNADVKTSDITPNLATGATHLRGMQSGLVHIEEVAVMPSDPEAEKVEVTEEEVGDGQQSAA